MTPTRPKTGRRLSANAARWLPVGLALLAFGLRVWRLGDVPPGWRDDELINSLVISTKVLNGDLALYYPDASGHEALYHALNAIFLALFGPNAAGIRLLSAFSGTLGVALTYRLGRRLFGSWAGAVAAVGLALSFWSLVYSRIGLRHILLPALVLLALDAFWRVMVGRRVMAGRHADGTDDGDDDGRRVMVGRHADGTDDDDGDDDGRRVMVGRSGRLEPRSYGQAVVAGVATGLGFYVYFAGRGVPLILLAFTFFVALFRFDLVRDRWRQLALAFSLMVAMALPLAWTLGQQPDAEGRVMELAVPVTAARAGNLEPLAEHVRVTLSMFHADGDPEWLYNIPGRPVFGPLGAVLFWAGVGFSLLALARGLWARSIEPAWPYAFLLLWWGAGVSPGFLSVPPASLGHTILALPATYLLLAVPVATLARRWRWPALALALLLVGTIAARDLPDYFVDWPGRGLVRFLYHADARDVANVVAADPGLNDFAITGLLAGPWNRLALEIDLAQATDRDVHPRWVNPERAVFLELGGAPALAFHGLPTTPGAFSALYGPSLATAGGYSLSRVTAEVPDDRALACFTNGLCLLGAEYDPAAQQLAATWAAVRALDLPDIPLISNPPPPGVYAGPRLWSFGQLVDAAGTFLVGDDGFWVDPETLQPGDVFRQVHHLPLPANASPAAIVLGLYDPKTGERLLTETGADHVQISLMR